MASHHPLSSDDQAFYAAVELASSSTLPMVLNSAIQLNLLQLIKDAGSAGSLSASDLASLIPTADAHHAASQIDRILRYLSAHSVVTCALKPLPDGDVQRFYSLTPIGNHLTADKDGVSLASIHSMIQDKVFIDTWYHLKDAVIAGGGIPFNMAHGMNAFEYPAVDHRFNRVFNQGMHHSSLILMNKIVDVYTGFEGVETLVDVGGGTGASLELILRKYPGIKGVNFDLPHVIEQAHPQPGVEHVGGDMFSSVPKGDAIFMKWILHDWSDQHCKKILKNCYEAILEKGKVIVAESILPRDRSSDEVGFRLTAQSDVLMLAYNPGGKERSEEEFEGLGKSAGFKSFAKLCHTANIWLMEFHK